LAIALDLVAGSLSVDTNRFEVCATPYNISDAVAASVTSPNTYTNNGIISVTTSVSSASVNISALSRLSSLNVAQSTTRSVVSESGVRDFTVNTTITTSTHEFVDILSELTGQFLVAYDCSVTIIDIDGGTIERVRLESRGVDSQLISSSTVLDIVSSMYGDKPTVRLNSISPIIITKVGEEN
jgi:hypothetical protein